MKKLKTALIIGILSMNAQASMPQDIMFKEGESIQLTLSKINFNRLYVKGEKITEIRFLEGTFTVEKPNKDEIDSGLESIYLKPTFDDKLTLFITTNKHHHFSIQANSDESLGKTFEMVPASLIKNVKRVADKPNNFIRKEKPQILSDLDQIFQDMENLQTPRGFEQVKFNGQSFFLQKIIKTKPIRVYQGNSLKSYVYEIENISKAKVKLDKAWFSKNKNTKAIHLSKNELNPSEKAYLYAVYNDMSRSRG